MRLLIIAIAATVFIGFITQNVPQGTFYSIDREHLDLARLHKSEAVVLAAKDCYSMYLTTAEKAVGRKISGYQWLGEQNHPTDISLRSSKGYTGFMSRVEQGLIQVVLAGLICRDRESTKTDSVTINEIASQLGNGEIKKRKAEAQKIVTKILLPYKKVLAQVSLADTVSLVKSYPVPKEPKPETWHTLFENRLASSDR